MQAEESWRVRLAVGVLPVPRQHENAGVLSQPLERLDLLLDLRDGLDIRSRPQAGHHRLHVPAEAETGFTPLSPETNQCHVVGGPFLSTQNPKIVLRPHGVFSMNSKLQGTIQAFDLEGRYLTECHSNNWSSPKEREKAAKEFAEWTKQPIQDCRVAMISAMEAARKAER